ncbi:hypothetical protein H7F51_06835 [Novosphingobium flavum]|uniref:Uncharacterized protein n=1 Tax=Novosphingobium flavum TaxID=1778672 RepID=A0A7X1FQR8_9SPHN|nr:hypothetical protein [Novosphingobium flavum]MBC2665228.1 hypothetical protein [Novosphingobium flavum]
MLLQNSSSVALSDFTEVSAAMLEGYAKFVRVGLPGQTVALAMLGATINLYEMFGMRGDLPEILRAMASRIEAEDEGKLA